MNLLKRLLSVCLGLLICSWAASAGADDFATLSKAVLAMDKIGIEAFVEAGGDLNLADGKAGKTALILAADRVGFEDMVLYLLEQGSAVDKKDKAGRTALSHAVAVSQKAAEYLLAAGAAVDAAADDGSTPLFWAIHGVKIRKVGLGMPERLIEKGADIHARMNQGMLSGWTPLFAAVNNDLPEVVSLLISKGARVNQLADNGTSALMWASRRGATRVVRMLLSHGADPRVVGKQGETALNWAMEGKHGGVADLLRQRLAP